MPIAELHQPKVGIHSPYVVKDGPDGVPRHVIEIKPYLIDKGWDVVLLGPFTRDRFENVADRTIGRPIKLSINSTNLHTSTSLNLRLAKKIHREEQFDVLDFHEPFATITTATLMHGDGGRVAMVGHFHAQAEHFTYAQRIGLRVVRSFPFIPFNQHYMPVGVSKNVIDHARQRFDARIAVSVGSGVFANKVMQAQEDFDYVPNGIETKRFTPEGPKTSWYGDGTNIVFAGRWDERKGILDLLEALDILRAIKPDIKLRMTGDGKMRKKVLAKIDELELWNYVDLLGIVPTEELPQIFRSADLVVAPSVGGEGWGRVSAEALACGTMVVSTDIAGIKEVLGNAPGAKLALPHDAVDLADKISEMLFLPSEQKERLRHEGGKYIEKNFAWPIVAEKTGVVYEKALRHHRDHL